MEIYGADINGISGQLIKFTSSIETKRTGIELLGNVKKIGKECYSRAVHAIDTLNEEWSIDGLKFTIDMTPPETPKENSGLALPLAIILLHGALIKNEETIEEKISEIEAVIEKTEDEKTRKELLDKIESLIEQREVFINYKKIIQHDKNKYLFIGDLDISNGDIRPPTRGVLCMLAAAKNNFIVFVPEDSEIHASMVQRVNEFKAFKAKNLSEVWSVILKQSEPRTVIFNTKKITVKDISFDAPDLKDIEYLGKAKKAMAIAVSGGHNILMVGPAGTGKSMLSKAATRLLPELTPEEKYEINKIYSVKGLLDANEIVVNRPFREVNSQTSSAALMGGGTGHPMPGEISLAHKGVLLLDEINLFSAQMIEHLRTALNDKAYTINRAATSVKYPASFILMASMNPCKCGNFGLYKCPNKDCSLFSSESNKICKKCNTKMIQMCHCTSREIDPYRKKLSKPLLERIDIKIMITKSKTEGWDWATSSVKRKIETARRIQQERYQGSPYSCNGDIPRKTELFKYDKTSHDTIINKIKRKGENEGWSWRVEDKVLLVSRTIADIAESHKILNEHLDLAIDIMGLNTEYFKAFE